MIPALAGSISPAAADTVSSELLVLGPSLGTATWLWDGALTELQRVLPAVRVLRFDLPGHGASPRAAAPFELSDLAEAVLLLVDRVGGGRFHYAGVSLGGAIGIELAARHPDRLLSLTAIATDARIGTADGWTARASQVRAQGTPSLVEASSQRWFAIDSIARDPDGTSRTLRELADVDDESYALAAEALGRFDRRDSLEAISRLPLPIVVVSGEQDPVTTSADLERLADRMGAGHVTVEEASHLVPLEQPEATAEAIRSVVSRSVVSRSVVSRSVGAAADAERGTVHERGMRVRREVLGNGHVDRAESRTTPETAAFQDFITRYAWGEIWNRPLLGRRERSIATIASLLTGGHDAEIAMHVRAGLRNGLTPAEIAEVMLHTALYAGLPAANAALAIARDVFAEVPADTTSDEGVS